MDTETTTTVDPDDDLTYHSGLSPEQQETRRLGRRPKVDHLPPGLDPMTRAPAFDVGDRIVVERRSDLLPNRAWLDTLVGKVRSIDVSAGTVSLVDEDSDPRLPRTRWASLKDPLHRFFFAPAKGDPFHAPKVVAKEHQVETADEIDAPAGDDATSDSRIAGQADEGAGGQKRKGRPKGSKNRPQAEIDADKKRRADERSQRQEAKRQKKRAREEQRQADKRAKQGG